MTSSKSLALLLAASALCVPANAAIVFNFEADTSGTSTTFTDTVNGLSATFSSSADPGGFVIYPTIFQTLTGNVLGDPGTAGLDNLSLNVGFSSNLSAVTLDFATSDFVTASPFTVSAYENNTFAGSATSTGQFLAGSTFPEGEISFAGAPFNRLVLSSTATDFAVDNIAVLTATTPEPALLPLLALGLIAAAAFSVRRRKLSPAGAPQTRSR